MENMVNQEGLDWLTNDPFVEHPVPDMSRHQLLSALHRRLAPRGYLEIGVQDGSSLALSRARSIGVDPEFRIVSELCCDVQLFAETSDTFFARDDAMAHLEPETLDLAFIDGMHLSDFVLRDFINTERRMAPGGVVVLDDALPRNHLEAYRVRRTGEWAGDVFKVLAVLRRHRPDLVVLPINTEPTGTALITRLDPNSTVLSERYSELEAELVNPDPQTVPSDLLTRSSAVSAVELMDHPVWSRIRQLREEGAGRHEFNGALEDLRSVTTS